MTERPIYLDHNATTPIHDEVLDAMLPYLREHFGNPSSAHAYGAAARAGVERAREQIASLIHCEADELVFTSGGTEGNNLAIRGALEHIDASRTRVVCTAVEHPATDKLSAWLASHGRSLVRVGVDPDGRAQLEHARECINHETALVSVMHSNNETGVLQPVRQIAALARARAALVHTDAAQSVGKVPVDVRELEVDLLSLVGHKLYAPKGVGALFIRRGVAVANITFGAGHERGLRPGTENVASIVALGAACAIAERDLHKEAARVRALRDELWTRIRDGVEHARLNGHPLLRLPNTLNVRFVGVSATALLERAPQIAASTGSACHDGHERASAVILAMGVSEEEALGSVRLTLGRSTSREDVILAANALVSAYRALRG